MVTLQTGTRVYNDGSPLSVTRWSSLFQAVTEEKRRNTVLSSPPPCSHLTCSSSLLLQSLPSFFTLLFVFFFSAVNCFQSTSSTLCYLALLLPATKVANVNNRRFCSGTILGVWDLFLPIRSVKSLFFRFLPELPSLNTSYWESEVVGWLWSGWKGQTGVKMQLPPWGMVRSSRGFLYNENDWSISKCVFILRQWLRPWWFLWGLHIHQAGDPLAFCERELLLWDKEMENQ